jgi:hypothetical protein
VSSSEKKNNKNSNKQQAKKVAKDIPTFLCTFCEEQVPCDVKDSHQCFLIEQKIRKQIKSSQ